MKHIWTDALPNRPNDHSPVAERHSVALPARLTWRDERGTTRFASVVARNVSEYGVYVECQSAVSIPMYRLVQFQLEREGREGDALPDALRRGRVLSAVYAYRRRAPRNTPRPGVAPDDRAAATPRRAARRHARNGLVSR